MNGTFTAKYVGPCGAYCGTRIEPGDEVIYINEELTHVDCVPGAEAMREGTGAACPRCWLVGTCDCTS